MANTTRQRRQSGSPDAAADPQGSVETNGVDTQTPDDTQASNPDQGQDQGQGAGDPGNAQSATVAETSTATSTTAAASAAVTSSAKSAAQKANEAVRPESGLHNLNGKQLTRVKFKHPWQRYAPNDRAGFDPATAAELIKRNIAEKI
ncbi:hypothetical protein QO259_17120 [Salinicola sp. JS01]|uniref:hypothetical protein n=1 Tax=Salinicola sp. JS01 TaxID=3050071 RepID=UPI00255B513C|nr:hypothetical protein [Salinicola sp. JS01]WIX32509.1 hypothetical protein QO259_17120 [Salinicola sp. JS01]